MALPEILDLVRQHNEYRRKCLNLQVSENCLSDRAREALASDMASRYSLEIEGKEAYGGARFSEEVLHSTEKLVAELYGSRYAEVRPIGGHIASEIVLLSLVSRRENILSIAERSGGYTGYESGYFPQMLGFRSYHIPYDDRVQEIRYDDLEKIMKAASPRLMVLGQSFFVRHYDLKVLRELCDRYQVRIAYDGSHVMGLIAGGSFQKDALRYCDVLFGSTHKSFFGPQGGIILTNDEEIMESILKNITWRAMDNFHPSRVAALGVAAGEMLKSGKEYASLVVSNSHKLGKEISERGLEARFSPWYSETHQVLLDEEKLKESGLSFSTVSERLESNGIIVDREGRIGTAEISRFGMDRMSVVADLMCRAISGENVKREVEDFREGFRMKY